MFDWTTASAEDVDHQYSPSRHAKRPLDEYLREYAERSAPFDPARTVVPGRPLLIYIHGGYWQRLSAADSLFNAPDAERLGFSLHAVEYSLAPVASVEQIIEECIHDIERVLAIARAPRVVIAGCSAGGHLAAMSAMSQRLDGKVDSVAILSGVFDVRPVVRTPTNDPLGLDMRRATAISPQLKEISTFPPSAVVAVGRHESDEFIRQSREFAEKIARFGTRTVFGVVENRDHFDLPYDLLRTGTFVGDHVISVLQGKEPQ